MNSDNFMVLADVLRRLPLGEKKYIGIYGLGTHTRRLLQAYQIEIGAIQANLVFIDSNKQTFSEKWGKYDVYNVSDIGSLPLDAIILSSFLYENEMERVIKQLYGNRFFIYKFYQYGQEEIFDAGGMYLKPEVQKTIKVNYVDFWPTFDPQHNIIASALLSRYNLELSEEPEFLFCSQFGQEHRNYKNCTKILYITEVMSFNLKEYDYAIGFQYINDSHFLHYNGYKPRYLKMLQNRERFMSCELAKRNFCNFIYSNESWGEGAVLRKKFCIELNKYRHIDCPGQVLNNMKADIMPRQNRGWQGSKQEFISKYKFTIAFENHMVEGYTTEKLWDCFKAGSIPIYWGNFRIKEEVKSEAFINCNDYDNDFDAVISRVKEMDADEEQYMYMLQKSPLKDSYDSGFRQMQSFLDDIIANYM